MTKENGAVSINALLMLANGRSALSVFRIIERSGNSRGTSLAIWILLISILLLAYGSSLILMQVKRGALLCAVVVGIFSILLVITGSVGRLFLDFLLNCAALFLNVSAWKRMASIESSRETN
jgi:peptidoglycan/LPS O-acetylase OafA/YrhL